MKNVSLFFTLLFGSLLLPAQEATNTHLFLALKQFQNPAAVANSENPFISGAYRNDKEDDRKNHFLSYEQPLSKSKFGFGLSYLLQQEPYLQLQQLGLAFRIKTQIEEDFFFSLGFQVNSLNLHRDFSRNTGFAPVPIREFQTDFPYGNLTDTAFDFDLGLWLDWKGLDIGIAYRHFLSSGFKYANENFPGLESILYLTGAYQIDLFKNITLQHAINYAYTEAPFYSYSSKLAYKEHYSIGIHRSKDHYYKYLGYSAGIKLWKLQLQLVLLKEQEEGEKIWEGMVKFEI